MTAQPSGVEYLFRKHAGEVLGTLTRRFGDLDLAEEALQDAVVEALVRWPREGEPANPAAWLVTVGRSKGVDRLRRAARRPDLEATARRGRPMAADLDEWGTDLDTGRIADDQLSLILLCCHPALSVEAQIAVTLRAVAGLSTEMIAACFVVGTRTMAQRIVRAKARIRDAGIPFGVADNTVLGERLDVVMHVLYLVFSAGHTLSEGDDTLRPELCGEAIRLARTLTRLVPQEPEPLGLLALMLLHDGRSPGRVGPDGGIVLLEHQDRGSWRREQISEGAGLVDRAMQLRRPGRYQVEAAIAALHSCAPTAAATDWVQIDALYAVLLRWVPTPVVTVNAAVARAMVAGPAAGLVMVEELRTSGAVRDWYLLHATVADLLRRSGRHAEALAAVRRAIELAPSRAERMFLIGREQQILAEAAVG
ncbi:hypothetical protein D1871_14490 [Nakamurella silvestris]|nr:hypothetical protein D1871_14490 [Nakamurella silvestris]